MEVQEHWTVADPVRFSKTQVFGHQPSSRLHVALCRNGVAEKLIRREEVLTLSIADRLKFDSSIGVFRKISDSFTPNLPVTTRDGVDMLCSISYKCVPIDERSSILEVANNAAKVKRDLEHDIFVSVSESVGLLSFDYVHANLVEIADMAVRDVSRSDYHIVELGGIGFLEIFAAGTTEMTREERNYRANVRAEELAAVDYERKLSRNSEIDDAQANAKISQLLAETRKLNGINTLDDQDYLAVVLASINADSQIGQANNRLLQGALRNYGYAQNQYVRGMIEGARRHRYFHYDLPRNEYGETFPSTEPEDTGETFREAVGDDVESFDAVVSDLIKFMKGRPDRDELMEKLISLLGGR